MERSDAERQDAGQVNEAPGFAGVEEREIEKQEGAQRGARCNPSAPTGVLHDRFPQKKEQVGQPDVRNPARHPGLNTGGHRTSLGHEGEGWTRFEPGARRSR